MASHPHFLWADLFRQKSSAGNLVPEALRQNVLFSTLTAKELHFLSSLIYERVYEAGETVFRQNDRGLGMYVIARGSVAIKATTPEKGEVEVARLEKGSFFGELSLIDQDNMRTATAVSLEKSVLIGFFKPDLMEILDRKPAMGVKILLMLSQVLGKRLMATTDRLSDMSEHDKVARIDTSAPIVEGKPDVARKNAA